MEPADDLLIRLKVVEELGSGGLNDQRAEQAVFLPVVGEKVVVEEDGAELLIGPPPVDHLSTDPRPAHVIPAHARAVGADRVEFDHVNVGGALALPRQRWTGRERVVELSFLDRLRQRVAQRHVDDLPVLGSEEQRLVRAGTLHRVAVRLKVVEVAVPVVPAVVVVVDPALADHQVVAHLPRVVAGQLLRFPRLLLLRDAVSGEHLAGHRQLIEREPLQIGWEGSVVEVRRHVQATHDTTSHGGR